MVTLPAGPHPSLYLLTDHLDAALAAGEDLLAEQVALLPSDGRQTIAMLLRQNRDLRQFVDRVRAFELTVTSRLLQARRRAEETRKLEPGLKPLIGLFLSGTHTLVDAVEEIRNRNETMFNTGDAALAFLRSRGLVSPDAAAFEGRSMLAATEDYLIAGRIRLGTLLDLVAMFLDVLDNTYGLFPDGIDIPDRPAAPQLSLTPEASVAET